MTIPRIIQISRSNAEILRQTLLASSPYEGCALLLGNQCKPNNSLTKICWQIQLIWPCCNIWSSKEEVSWNKASLNIDNLNNSNFSKRNRFKIDPKEQILAQKWSRSSHYKVLGSAHSHISDEAVPSSIDLSSSLYSRLMLIIDQSGNIRAWWIPDDQNFEEVQVSFSINSKNIRK
mgnify:CR=1 FL=1